MGVPSKIAVQKTTEAKSEKNFFIVKDILSFDISIIRRVIEKDHIVLCKKKLHETTGSSFAYKRVTSDTPRHSK